MHVIDGFKNVDLLYEKYFVQSKSAHKTYLNNLVVGQRNFFKDFNFLIKTIII